MRQALSKCANGYLSNWVTKIVPPLVEREDGTPYHLPFPREINKSSHSLVIVRPSVLK
jgi:hypothetical protein